MSHKHPRRARRRTFRKAGDRQQRPPERTHEDLLKQLTAKLARIQDKHGPRSEEARAFIKKHIHVKGFEDLAMTVTMLKDGTAQEVLSRLDDPIVDFAGKPVN